MGSCIPCRIGGPLVTLAETKTEFNNWLSDDATISFLEKAQAGKTTLDDISDALEMTDRRSATAFISLINWLSIGGTI